MVPHAPARNLPTRMHLMRLRFAGTKGKTDVKVPFFVRPVMVALLAGCLLSTPLMRPAVAATRTELEGSSKAALNHLVATVAAAKALNDKAVAVLVFPSITKARLLIGGQYGEGVLWRRGTVEALGTAQGFEIGVGPSVVVMDEGMGKATTTTTMQDDIYAFIFSQKGLMAGLGLQGNKIDKIEK